MLLQTRHAPFKLTSIDILSVVTQSCTALTFIFALANKTTILDELGWHQDVPAAVVEPATRPGFRHRAWKFGRTTRMRREPSQPVPPASPFSFEGCATHAHLPDRGVCACHLCGQVIDNLMLAVMVIPLMTSSAIIFYTGWCVANPCASVGSPCSAKASSPTAQVVRPCANVPTLSGTRALEL